VNHFSLVGPYTSSVHEMRGEILVQLEKFNHREEENREYTTSHPIWQVLDSAKYAEELEKIMASSNQLLEADQVALLDLVKSHHKEHKGLPFEIMQQLEQFFLTCVSPLQEKTQELYGDSLELLFRYLKERFGSTFQWDMLDEENLTHFFSVWYLDHVSSTPTASKIFLNTIKHFFRWLAREKISSIYQHIFQKIYLSLIRSLPTTIEARKWLKENAVHNDERVYQTPALTDLYQLSVSSTGPVLLVGDKWVPVKLNGFPPMWAENRFWIRGSIQKRNAESVFTKIENVYPVFELSEEIVYPSLRYIENE
jgi:hypothetical protein